MVQVAARTPGGELADAIAAMVVQSVERRQELVACLGAARQGAVN